MSESSSMLVVYELGTLFAARTYPHDRTKFWLKHPTCKHKNEQAFHV
jgi:hypothetical protein